MEKLRVKLEHCYGIKKLEEVFDFSDFKTFLIYAPNGVMKTSFAKTLKALSTGKNPCDQMDDTLTSVFDFLIDDSDEKISPDEICVIEPYNEKVFESGDKILTLLANDETRKEYFEIYNDIDFLKKATLSSLKKISGSSNYEAEINESFSSLGKKNIFETFDSVLDDINSSKEEFDFTYNHVFDSKGKVKDFLGENMSLLEQYTQKYEELINQSDFFGQNSDNIFGTTEASALNKSLEGDDYFVAGHKLLLKNHGEISERDSFLKIFDEEVDKIFNDDELKEIYKKIDKALEANAELKAFKKVIASKKTKHILPRLINYDLFRQEVWFSFLKQIEPGLVSLVELYNQKKPELEAIIQKAENDKPRWESAIKEFENRFVNMPFSVEINNVADAVLNEQTPSIDFKFKGKNIERTMLIKDVLSQGERRAFYLLNVIFEIKSRQLQGKKTLFVIDDIADSFDYKNKYAIVEYLKDLSRDSNFYSIILTHNFDFFRTLRSRILFGKHKRTHSFVAERFNDEITLVPAVNRNVINPFANWRTGTNSNKKHLIACIPFVRNLIEFKDGHESGDYKLLTHILHQKELDEVNNIKASSDIYISDIEPIFDRTLSKIEFEFEDKDTTKITEVIDSVIAEIMSDQNSDTIVLEDKIVLAIGIRLKSEEYILSTIPDIDPISGSQTGVLIGMYKEKFHNKNEHIEAIKILESVSIITPENIHLNSFMYEPILDMGIAELKNLHNTVSALLIKD